MTEERREHPRLWEVPIVSETMASVRAVSGGLWELAQRAYTSHVSDLLNKAAFEEYGRVALRTGKSRDLVVVFTDLSGFKKVNDQLDHSAGDALLREVGRVLESIAKPLGGLAYHLSGDEFALLFESAQWTAAKRALTEQAHTVQLHFDHQGKIVPLTTKLYFGFVPPDAESPLGESMRRAEEAAKYAKFEGNAVFMEWNDSIEMDPLKDPRRRCDSCNGATRLLVPQSALVEGAPEACANCGKPFPADPEGQETEE